jgi:UDP-glucose 4-epimerase
VWGARGFIGRHLVTHLLAHGWNVRVLARPAWQPAPPWADDVDWVVLDAADRARSFDAALEDATTVFNLAGSSGAVASNRNPLESLESNCALQLQFLEACARSAATPHIVFASSRLVYAHAGTEPVTERHPVEPASIYAAHKLCVEAYLRVFAQRGAVTFTVCRISNPYGWDEKAPDKAHGFVNALVQRSLAGQPLTIFGNGLQLRDYLYIDDLVQLLRMCAERNEARNEVLNIGCGASVSIADAARLIQRAFGGGPIEWRPWPKEYMAVETGDYVADVGKARRVLGFAARHDFAGGLEAIKTMVAEPAASRAFASARSGQGRG